MQFFREWSQRLNTRKGLMLSVDKFAHLERSYDAGYQSVYMFDQETAETISASGSSKGFAEYDVYSNEIFIDIDTGAYDMQQSCWELRNHGYAYKVYWSGSKGYHIRIPLDQVYKGKDVPYSQLQWVKEHVITGYDPSIYKASSLISLPGRKHPKTGVRKYLLHAEPGKPASMTLVPRPVVEIRPSANDDDCLRLALIQLSQLASAPPGLGERHSSLWKTALSLHEAGIEVDTTTELLCRINETWPNAKEAEEVERAIGQAYGS